MAQDEGAGNGFVDVVVYRLINVLKKDMLTQFRSKMYNVQSEVTKADNMADAMQKFTNAQDQETIIKHI